jgi:hypothetical protein
MPNQAVIAVFDLGPEQLEAEIQLTGASLLERFGDLEDRVAMLG